MKAVTLLITLFLTCVAGLCSAQIITTFAGNDQNGTPVDGQPAIDAPLSSITSIRIGKDGNVYFVDGHIWVKQINVITGIITTIAGNGIAGFSGDGGPAVQGSLNNPTSLCFDNNGKIYVCDSYNNRVRRIDALTNEITTIVGNGTTTYRDGASATNTGIPPPSSIDVDNAGNLYFGSNDLLSPAGANYIFKVDAVTGIIRKIAGNGSNTFSGTGTQALQTGFYVYGIRIGNNGLIYLADMGDNSILQLDPSSGIMTVIAGGGSPNMEGYRGDGEPAINALLNEPTEINFDVQGNLLIWDAGNLVIRKIDMTSGIIYTVAGTGITGYYGDGGPATCAKLLSDGGSLQQAGLTADNHGNFYFADQTDKVIRKVDNTSFIPESPSFTISTPSTTICLGETVHIDGILSDSASSLLSSPLYQWLKDGTPVGGDSAAYISRSLLDQDTVLCLVETRNTACQLDTISSNPLIFTLADPTPPVFALSAGDTAICAGQLIAFQVVGPAEDSISYQWQLNGYSVGGDSAVYSTNSVGNGNQINCIVSYYNPVCQQLVSLSSDTLAIPVNPAPSIQLSPSDTLIVPGATVQLHATSTADLSSYQWTPITGLSDANDLNPVASPRETTIYTFKATATDHCKAEKTLIVQIGAASFPGIPNAFTPNGDGHNDLFTIPPVAGFSLTSMVIYDRWGSIVFSTQNVSAGWDGTCKGAMMPSGTYVYVIRGAYNNMPVFRKGTIMLIR
jgi:gliding motility-associated-like protein